METRVSYFKRTCTLLLCRLLSNMFSGVSYLKMCWLFVTKIVWFYVAFPQKRDGMNERG